MVDFFMEKEMLFSCTRCGECCSGEMKIFLNPYDLFKIATFLHYPHTEMLFETGLIEFSKERNDILLPKIRFKSKPFPFCPFLENREVSDRTWEGLCTLHPHHKPLICSLAPLSREFDSTEKTNSFYITPPHPSCPGFNENVLYSLEEEIKRHKTELDLEEEFFVFYNNLLSKKSIINYKNLFLFEVKKGFSETWDSIQSLFVER